ncbi:MAG: nucleotide exchange factor GrpE [Candidatus Altiarchaeales archaeon ex4484_43]|nr:MAG: nucleotide exchange factor GrpE [Candidatus Altiarchaeales archaeon ex4484_43]
MDTSRSSPDQLSYINLCREPLNSNFLTLKPIINLIQVDNSVTPMHKKRGKRGKTKKELEAELKEKEEDILRLRADFENYRKQLNREKEEFAKIANEKLITQLLDVVDNFERAISTINDKETMKGIKMVYRQFYKILEENGLKKIEALGKKFDPYYHEVLMREESDKEDGTIIEEFQTGYMLKEKVIRHSKVKVAKNIKDE